MPRKPLAEIFAPTGGETPGSASSPAFSNDANSDLPKPANLDTSRIPGHVAVIMDGNGRWAKRQGKSRVAGHRAGVAGVRELIRTANDLGVDYLTIYSFSTENWSRPRKEVQTLMDLFARTMRAELAGLLAEQVRIRLIGSVDSLPKATRESFLEAVQESDANSGMTLVIAVNYGARREIVSAAKRLAAAALAQEVTAADLEALDEQGFGQLLSTAGIPDPELLIRTGGEYRLSNFLLYQVAYSEFYVTSLLWPDFDRWEFLRALLDYQQRQRRFGGGQCLGAGSSLGRCFLFR